MEKKYIRLIAIAVIIVLVACVYIAKNGSELGIFQDTVSENAGNLQEKKEPLEVSFDAKMIQENELPLILVLGSDTCGPCMRMLPDLEMLKDLYDGRANVAYIDIRKNPEVMQYIPVRVTPTIAVYEKDGKPFEPGDEPSFRFILYSDRNTGEHMVTVTEGALPLESLRTLAEELIVD